MLHNFSLWCYVLLHDVQTNILEFGIFYCIHVFDFIYFTVYFTIYLVYFIVCIKRSEASWAFNKISCYSDDIVDKSEQEQEDRINFCFSQQINDDTGKIIFIWLWNGPIHLIEKWMKIQIIFNSWSQCFSQLKNG